MRIEARSCLFVIGNNAALHAVLMPFILKHGLLTQNAADALDFFSML